MKRAAGLLGLGVLALLVQGAAVGAVPPRFVPDLSLLVVVGLAAVWPSTLGGVVVATLLGYLADLLSGALLGQHALLRLLVYGAARVTGRHLSLRGGAPLVVFGVLVSAGHGLAMAAVTVLFTDSTLGAGALLRELPFHALLTGLLAPFVVRLTRRVSTALGEDEDRRLLRFATGTFPT